MYWNNKVIWSEGMFLQPQHFQQHDRYLERWIEGRTRPLLGYHWGFAELEIDKAALAVGKIQLSAARGIFPDGTPFDFPAQDRSPEPLAITANTKDECIVLALPIRRESTQETSTNGEQAGELTRYTLSEETIIDSNHSSARSTLMQLGHLRLKLMRSCDVTDAYSVMGVVKVMECREDRQVILNPTYIPPVLHVSCHSILISYIQELQGLIYQRGRTLAARLSQPGNGGVSEIADFLFLQTLNRYTPLFAHYIKHPYLHPEQLFSICLQIAGDFAIFAQQQPLEFPAYQHDALEVCFTPLMATIRQSLSTVIDSRAVPIELQMRQHRVRVAMIPDKSLIKNAYFILAVNAQLPVDALRTRFSSQIKIGPLEQIANLVNLNLPGVLLRSLPVAPREIPFHANFSYFELERNGELWKQLETSAGMAMHIPDNFPGLEIECWAIKN